MADINRPAEPQSAFFFLGAVVVAFGVFLEVRLALELNFSSFWLSWFFLGVVMRVRVSE